MDDLETKGTVVEPGSTSDPFSVNYDPASEGVKTSPVVIPNGVAVASTADGPQAQAAAPATNPTGQALAPQTASPAAGSGTPQSNDAGLDIEARIKDAVGKITRGLQSTNDKRIAALEKQLTEAREATIKAERDAKLGSEDLTDEEKDLLRAKYALDDEKTKLRADIEANDKYYRELQVARLSKDFSQFGVTAEDLDAITDPDEMETFAKGKELEFYRSGKSLVQAIATAPVVTPQAQAQSAEVVPAGATAPSHIGGDAPAAKAPEFDRSVGQGSLLANLKNLPTETIQFN